jgi:hypothetical protein
MPSRIRLGENDEWYEWDGDVLLVREARELKKLTGMGVKEFANGIVIGDIDALMFMYYLARRRAAAPIPWRELDELNVGDLDIQDAAPALEVVSRPPAKRGKKTG